MKRRNRSNATYCVIFSQHANDLERKATNSITEFFDTLKEARQATRNYCGFVFSVKFDEKSGLYSYNPLKNAQGKTAGYGFDL